MESIFDINSINLCIGGIILILSIVLSMIPIQMNERWNKIRRGRVTMVIAYIVLGLLMIVDGIPGTDSSSISGMITLMVAAFQALFFTKICNIFLKPISSDGKDYKRLLLASGTFSIILVASYIINGPLFKWMFHIGIGLYAMLLVYCCFAFIRNYNDTLKRLEYVFDEDMYYSVRWVKGCFYSAQLIGVMVLFMALFHASDTLNIIGIFIYTVYYLIMVGYFIRYVSNYGFILKSEEVVTPSIVQEKAKGSHLSAIEDRRITEGLEKWVEKKKYRDNGKTLDEIVAELHTTRSELNEYMKKHFNTNFRAWRNNLRIEEAKKLLADTSVPEASIYIAVGYTDRSNFHRHFCEATGMTPTQYRSKVRM